MSEPIQYRVKVAHGTASQIGKAINIRGISTNLSMILMVHLLSNKAEPIRHGIDSLRILLEFWVL